MPNTIQTGDDCFRLIYRSHSKIAGGQDERDAELADILKTARRNNPAHGLTGALVLYDQWFAQVLEGEEAEVRDLLSKIEKDPRHDGVKVFDEEKDAKRVFGRWAMAMVAEHGQADIPLVPRKGGVVEGQDWKSTAAQEAIVDKLRNLTRGYGVGA